MTIALIDALSQNLGSHLINPLIGLSLACLFIGALVSMRQNRKLRDKRTVYIPSGETGFSEAADTISVAPKLKGSIVDPAELLLFQTVAACLPPQIIGLYGLRLQDVMEWDAAVSLSGAVQRERIDCVLCDVRSGAVRGIIMITDSRSHIPAFDQALASCGAPVLHLQSRRSWSSGQMAYMLKEGLGIPVAEVSGLADLGISA